MFGVKKIEKRDLVVDIYNYLCYIRTIINNQRGSKMEKLWASFNRLEIQLEREDAFIGYHSGDCQDDVLNLMNEPYIKEQLDEIDPEKLKTELEEYGTWDDKELSNHEDNKMRILWLACGDIVDNLEE
jgi:hypothetical protein